MQKFYLDTCIWRDFYEDRFSRSGKPLGKYATELFMNIIKNKDKILFSESIIFELRRDYSIEEIKNMLSLLFFDGILIRIDITPEETAEARLLSEKRGLPFIDCLHAVQAKNHNAIMVSQDEHFIKNLSDITKTVKPEQLI